MSRLTKTVLLLVPMLVAACATGGGPMASAGGIGPSVGHEASGSNQNLGSNAGGPRGEPACSECTVMPLPADVTRAVETRIEALKARGGDCSRYGTLLEQSYRTGRIMLRPYMWRVGRNLASGEAKPNGDMTLAREIDALNVGVRTVDDVVFSMEHEAVHITFDLASGNEASEDKANQIVRGCQA